MADDFKYHIDHAGSLVRPAALLDARREHAAGRLDDAGLAAAEDAAVAEAARMQRRVGLSAIGDGQYRRSDLASIVPGRVAGFGGTAATPLSEALTELGGLPPAPAVVAKLEPAGRLAAHEAAALVRAVPQRSTVLALPSAAYVAERSYDPDRTASAYATSDVLGAELAGLIRDEVQALAADGIDHVRLVNPGYALTLTTAGRERLRAAGTDPDVLLDRMAATDASSIERIEAGSDFRISLDITTCGAQLLAGEYDPAAVTRFYDRLPFYRCHVDHPADEKARFPLNLVPPGRVVALGIVDASSPAPEPVDDLLDRVDAATKTLDIDDIAISTNGGFAPTATTQSQISWETQHTKLQLVETVARYYWGNEL